MNTIFDIANYILEKEGSMTTMKLQKLCYFSQGWSLAWDNKPIFNEDFEAWANGPVNRELFEKHKGKFEISSNFFKQYTTNSVSKEAKENIDIVLEAYKNIEPLALSRISHSERPWIESRGHTKEGERCNTIISKDLMQEYYSGLMENE